MSRNRFRAFASVAALLAVGLVAMPALGVDPSRSPSTGGLNPSAAPASVGPSAAASAAAPAASPEAVEPDEDGQGAKADKGPRTPEHPVTLRGVVGRAAGEDGEFTLTVGSTVYRLSAGPRWWWGDASPLAAVVGKTVTIDGEQAEGSDEVDVLAIDGKAIRTAGRPPWAGGWKVVGSRHPGWAQWKVDKAQGGGHGRDTAPGQLKQDD
jgi:hypothetical protein